MTMREELLENWADERMLDERGLGYHDAYTEVVADVAEGVLSVVPEHTEAIAPAEVPLGQIGTVLLGTTVLRMPSSATEAVSAAEEQRAIDLLTAQLDAEVKRLEAQVERMVDQGHRSYADAEREVFGRFDTAEAAARWQLGIKSK